MRCEKPKRVNGTIVPCGRCVACRKDRSNELEARFLSELNLLLEGGLFITLTYNPEVCPVGMCLDKAAPGTYMNRLAVDFRRRGIIPHWKYVATGEYGKRTDRPHYHIVVIGITPTPEVIRIFEENWKRFNKDSFVYIKPLWQGKRAIAGIKYVTGYITKTNPKWQLQPEETLLQFRARTGRTPEFSTMSKGFGLNYLKSNVPKIVSLGYLRFGPFKFALPRYYLKKLKELVGPADYATLLEKHYKYLDSLCEKRPEKLTKVRQELHKIDIQKMVDVLIKYREAEFFFKSIFDEEWDIAKYKFQPQKIPKNAKYYFFTRIKMLCFRDVDRVLGKKAIKGSDRITNSAAIGLTFTDLDKQFNGLGYPGLLLSTDFVEKVFNRFVTSKAAYDFFFYFSDMEKIEHVLRWNFVIRQTKEAFLDECVQSAKNLRRQLEIKYNMKL